MPTARTRREAGGTLRVRGGAGVGGARAGRALTAPVAGLEGDVGAPGEKPRTSTDSVLITVLWRRLSMFSRRGSTRRGSASTPSTRSHRQSVQSQRLGVALHEMNPEGIKEESSEKG